MIRAHFEGRLDGKKVILLTAWNGVWNDVSTLHDSCLGRSDPVELIAVDRV